MVFANYTNLYETRRDSVHDPLRQMDIQTAWTRVLKSGKKVIAIRDVPLQGHNLPDCLSRLFPANSCGAARESALLVGSTVQAASNMSDSVSLIDLSSLFCGDTECPAVVGDLVVYFDSSHLLGSFARTLTPYLGKDLAAALEVGSGS